MSLVNLPLINANDDLLSVNNILVDAWLYYIVLSSIDNQIHM